MVWAESEKTGGPVPVDAVPVERGNILLQHKRGVGEPPIAHVVTKKERLELVGQHAHRIRDLGHPDEPFQLFISHFATCPQAAQFRHGNSKGSRS
jgi:hypothetical protein